MKYYYGDLPKSQVIKNYKVVLDTIVVTFLDDSNCQFPYSKETEQKIVKLMLEQAKKRDTSENSVDLKMNRNANAGLSLATGAAFVFGTIAWYTHNDPYSLVLVGSMGVACALQTVIPLSRSQEKVEDFKKYSLYLSLLKNKKHIPEGLSINTLDNYSLKEVKEKVSTK